MVGDWMEASAAIEEVNRVAGVRLAVQAYHTPDRAYDALAAELMRQAEAVTPPDGTVLAFFPPTGPGTSSAPDPER